QQGSIKTAGKQSPGVLGQSVGGGGGSGGLTHGDTRADTGSVAVSLGRSGGSGGDAGAVTITQRTGGRIETTGMASDGLVAQSVGGGGGIGGAVGDKNQPDWPPIPALPDGGGGFTASASLTLGGSGGAGGAGKTVTVTQNGRIETRGRQSSAVVAQSIGGGGGRAGSTATSAPGGTLGLSLTLGGSGGAGGDGGQVTVKQTGVILTSGMGSTGVLAQSIGGGGGAGSSSESTQSPGKVTANLSIGGSGGQGGDGGDVHLDHSGVIRSSASDALLVQSIGGGGGQAGAVYGGVNIDGTDAIRSLSPPEEGFAFTVTVGARGGNGGNGGTATVNNSGSLSSNGDTRAAATVQSIGGGGGTGGIASAFYDVSPLANQPVAQMSLALGGSGGAGGHGGSVTWKSTARTAGGGIMSDAIRLQSIGGGGGVAASQMAAVSRDDGPTGPTYRLTGAVVSLQGRGGSGGMGGNVTATQEARAHIETAGESSIGLLAQSVGGGGGISVAHFPQGAAKTGLNLGGGVGAGGKVTLNQSGIVETSHAGSHAILAQSVGGGGGATRVLGADQSTQIFNAAREGDGNGGTVAVAINSSGSIITAGIGSYGVLAQSIGGGGGYLNTGVWAAPAEGSLTQTHAGTGDGGSVTVEVAGSVRTRGDNSAAVFAQSVGGGGGIADGIAGRAGQDGKGSGGAVTIKINGLVEATGKNAHGVFAQSVGENNGNIQVTLSGTGLAQGGSGEAAGIRLSGGKGNQIRIGEQARVGALSDMAIRTAGGDTEITNAGNIRGSVWLQQSSPGKLTNSGSLAAGSRLDLAGGDLINNGVLTIGTGDALASSTLSGNLRQGVSGTYAPRVDFALARADMLAITGEAHLNGKLAINGMNHQPMQRDIEVLSAQSAYRVDPAFQVVDNAVFQYPTAWRDNRLHVGIKADFSAHNDVLSEDQGQLSSYLGRRWKGLEQQLAQSDAPAQVSAPATQTASSTTGSRSLSTLTRVAPTAAATRAVSLAVAPPEATSRTPTVAASTTSVSSGTAAPSPIAREAAKYTPVFDTIAQAPDAEAYADVLDQIANDAIQAPATVMPLAHRMFLNRSLSCPTAGGGQAKPLDSACIWGDIEGNWLDRGSQHHDTGFSYESVRYMLGAQHPLGRGWVVGGGVSYEDARSKTDDTVLKTTGHSVSGMAFLRKIDGPWTYTGALSAGYGSYETHRAVSTVSGVQKPNSDWNTHFASVRAQLAYTHQRESYYLKPALDVDVIYQRVPAYSEKGGGAFNLAFDSASAVRTMISPSVEFGGTLEAAQITMRPFVSVGLNWMPDNDWKTDARLKADRSGDSFRLSGSLPDVFAEYRVGMELETREGFVMRTEWRQRLADRYNERSAELRLGMRF
ncbi:autotransporter domain-containing protein, partial [Bordetella sp. 15P40C-2]|nr:autotransporter domain-containing protein [Bordetella sp. 15P40C-2]